MHGLLKAEFIKLQRRKDFLLFATMIFLPIFYSIGLAAKSSAFVYASDEKMTFLSFYSQMVVFAYMIFIYLVVLNMCAVRSLRGEIDNKSIRLYLQRVKSRHKVYLAKHITMIGSALIAYAAFFAACVICYYALVVRRADIALADFLRPEDAQMQIGAAFAIFLYFMIVVFTSFMAASFCASGISTGVVMLEIVLFSYMKEFPIVKCLSPAYYIQEIIYIDSKITVFQGLIGMACLTAAVCAAAYFIGSRQFAKSDV